MTATKTLLIKPGLSFHGGTSAETTLLETTLLRTPERSIAQRVVTK